MTFVRYDPGVEQIQPNETETLDELSAIVRRIQEHALHKSGDAKRATYCKATALLKNEPVIPDDLAPELAQGLFARPGRRDALVRFSQGPSEHLSDKASGSVACRSRPWAWTGCMSRAAARRPHRMGAGRS